MVIGIMRAFLGFWAILCIALLPAGAAQAQQARAGERADFLLIDKSDRRLWVYQDGKVIRSYSGLQYGDQPVGHKRFQGDERTPEGRYTISYGNPQSSYYLSLHIDYPNAQDRPMRVRADARPGG
jgi:murein L,D-transpeptidase YafK